MPPSRPAPPSQVSTSISVDTVSISALIVMKTVSQSTVDHLIQYPIQLLIHVFYPIVAKGISHNLMKVGAKRRRTKAEVVQEKLDAETKRREMEAKLEKFDRMQTENIMLQSQKTVAAEVE